LDFLRDGPSHCKEQWRDKRRQDSSKIQTSAAKDSSRIQMIEMAKAAKSRHVELELVVDVASRQTLKKGPNPGFLPRAGQTVLLPLGPESCARYKVLTLESFMGYRDEAGAPEAQTSYFKIAIYAEREH